MTDDHKTTALAPTIPARTGLHPLAAQILAQKPTPETLRELMNLQREWDASEAKKAYARALVELQAEMPAVISRDKTVFHNEKKMFTHASMAHVYETVRPHLVKFGFSLTSKSANVGDKIAVTTTLMHREGHSESMTIPAPPDTTGSKSAVQAIASTMTYLQRHSALQLLGISTADMEEPGDAPETTDPSRVDTKANLAMAAELKKAGKTRQQGEEHVGKPLPQWTSAELARLRSWIAPPKAEQKPVVDTTAKVEPVKATGEAPKRCITPTQAKELINKARTNKWEDWQIKATFEERGWKASTEIPANELAGLMEYFSKPRAEVEGPVDADADGRCPKCGAAPPCDHIPF